MAGVKSSVRTLEVSPKATAANGRTHARPVSRPAIDPAKQLYESIPHAVLVLGRDAHILHANPRAEEILGLALTKMRGHRSNELWIAATEDGRPLADDDRPEMRALATCEPVRGQGMRIRRPDSDWVWIQADAVPVIGADGAPFQVVCSFFDITDRRLSEAALKESERELRSMFAGAGIGMARLRLDGTVTDVNPALVKMLGYSKKEFVGKPLAEFMFEEDAADVRIGELSRFDLGTVRADIRCRAKDGGTVWARSVASLVRDVRGAPASVVLTLEDISDQKAHQRDLEHQVLHDTLTGLPNRVLLHERLSNAILVGRREGHRMALLLMDLNGFKEVNDALGHQAGDQLLRQVAARVREELRISDTVARLGGDEFAIILPGVGDHEDAAQAANKLVNALGTPFDVAGERLHVAASIGIALFPEHGEDVDTLLRRADIAMYVAKRGDSDFAIYSPDQDEHSPSRLAMMGELRQALEEDQLVLHYQPKVELRSGHVVGVEALVRWQHPRLGMLPPDRFMPLAEHSGLVRPLDRWVLEAAIRQCREWRDQGLNLTAAINLSMRTLHDRELPDFVAHVLNKYGLEASAIQVEITESTLMANPELAVEVTTRLAQMGVRLAIDDFGTGYSSLAYVRRLQAAEIKIDRSFVLEMARAENDAVIVQSTIELGRNLGLQVVAEGVENQETREMLLAGGCELAQGFMLSRPLTSEELTDQLKSGSSWTPLAVDSAPPKVTAPRSSDRLRRPAFSFDEVNRRLAVLEPVSLFFALPSSDVWRLARHMQPEYLPAGAEIVSPTLGGDSLRIIEEGFCEVSVEEGGERVPVLTLGPSEFVGAESLAPEEQVPVFVKALTDVKLLVLEREVLARSLPADSELFDVLRQVATQRKARLLGLTARARNGSHRGTASSIAIYSPKGGSGKTTIALNLAAKLVQDHPGDVLLVDLSLPFNHAALMANLVPTSCLARVAQAAAQIEGTDAGDAGFERILMSALLPHPTGFMLLPTALKAEEADLIDPALIVRTLDVLGRQFKYVVFDLGVALSDNVLSVLELSQHLVTVTAPELTAMADTAQVLDIVTRVLQMPVGRVHLVMNNRTPHAAMHRKDVEQVLKREIEVEFPYEGARPEQAAVRGMLLGAADPKGRFQAGTLELVRLLNGPSSRTAGVSAGK
jgi:diguanylate cyclase (GGDEF)-like protein/PAS domain S-box-containing protein